MKVPPMLLAVSAGRACDVLGNSLHYADTFSQRGHFFGCDNLVMSLPSNRRCLCVLRRKGTVFAPIVGCRSQHQKIHHYLVDTTRAVFIETDNAQLTLLSLRLTLQRRKLTHARGHKWFLRRCVFVCQCDDWQEWIQVRKPPRSQIL